MNEARLPYHRFPGKRQTTLLNRIIDFFPQEKKLTILMNEFGEIGYRRPPGAG